MPSEFSFNEQKWKKNVPSIDSDETGKSNENSFFIGIVFAAIFIFFLFCPIFFGSV